MPAVKSYAWAAPITDVISNGELANVPTPGFVGPENYLTDKTEAVVKGAVLRPEEFSVAWQDNFARVEVTNLTQTDWVPGDTLFVTVAGKTFDPTDVVDSFANLEARVSANETAIMDLQTRVSKLEARPGGGPPGMEQAPTTELEPPGEPTWTEDDIEDTEKPHKAGHVKAPQHRGSAKS